MKIFYRFRKWEFEKHRTEAFSDGVFAIIITLLILEIKLPHLTDACSTAQLLEGLKDMLPKIISWVVSFFFVAVMWVQHHNVFRMAEKIDYGLVWINNAVLMLICFLPFPTALLGDYPSNRAAVLIFGAVATVATLLQVTLYRYIAIYHLKNNYNKASVLKNVRRAYIMAPLLLIVATAVSFVSLALPYLIYAIVPFFFMLPLDDDNNRYKG